MQQRKEIKGNNRKGKNKELLDRKPMVNIRLSVDEPDIRIHTQPPQYPEVDIPSKNQVHIILTELLPRDITKKELQKAFQS